MNPTPLNVEKQEQRQNSRKEDDRIKSMAH